MTGDRNPTSSRSVGGPERQARPMMTPVEEGLTLLVGLECSAVCFTRDYVELHFDGPVVRCLTNPRGRWGEWGWRFPDGNAASAMLLYIGKTVTETEYEPGRSVALDFYADRWTIPLDDESRVGPEAVHILGTRPDGSREPSAFWID